MPNHTSRPGNTGDFFSIPTKSIGDGERTARLSAIAKRLASYCSSQWRAPGPPDGLVVVMPEGFGKSSLAAHLIGRGFKIVMVCKSNAQVKEKLDEVTRRWPGNPAIQALTKKPVRAQRFVSREQNMRERLALIGIAPNDFKLPSYASTNPYAVPGVNDEASIQALQALFATKGIEEDASQFFIDHYVSYSPEYPDGRHCEIVLLTLSAFQAICNGKRDSWWQQLGLIGATRNIEVTEENIHRLRRRQRGLSIGDHVPRREPLKKIAVIIDDPDRSDVDWLRRVNEQGVVKLSGGRDGAEPAFPAEDARHWLKLGYEVLTRRISEQPSINTQADVKSDSECALVRFKGSAYAVRPRSASLGFHLKNRGASPKVVVTTTEYITGYYALQTLNRMGLRTEDHLDVFHTTDCNVTAIATTIVRSKTHALLLPILAKLRSEFPNEQITLIADGLGSEVNLSNNKGRNDLADRATVVKLSWPHPSIIATIGAHFPQAQNHDLMIACALGDIANQALGRNQGFRFMGRQALLLVDPRWYDVLIANELIRYRLNPWSTSLPKLNRRTTAKGLRFATAASEHQSALEKRLIELIASASSFGESKEAARLMDGRPESERKVFWAWRESVSSSAGPADTEQAKRDRRRAQVAEAVRRHRAKKAASRPEGV
jgi:hypothetical protein